VRDLFLTDPTMVGDESFQRWYAQIARMAASPATAAAMARQWFDIDVRAVLPTIKVPTLVIARAGNATFPANHARYLAEHISGPTYVEFPGADLQLFVGDADPILNTIEEFVTGMPPQPSPDRFLGTVLFVDVVGSTQLAATIGDSRFAELLGEFVQLLRRQMDRYQGQLVDTAGDGALALFDSPARAITCAEAVRDSVRALGLQIRAGVHAGEMEHGPAGQVRGIAVHTGARVAALAGPGDVLVSRTIRDLVAGAPIRLDSRGSHKLKGVQPRKLAPRPDPCSITQSNLRHRTPGRSLTHTRPELGRSEPVQINPNLDSQPGDPYPV
jgi:class 3 adenylate cyclase